jgi:hypothetical protein
MIARGDEIAVEELFWLLGYKAVQSVVSGQQKSDWYLLSY